MKFDTTFVLNNFLFPLRVYESNVLHYVCWGKQLLDLKLIKDKDVKYLRAVVSNFRESGDRAENSNFFLFAQKNPFGELFSKIIFKSSSQFLFWQKTESSKLA